MGVRGLWQVIDNAGKNIDYNQLNGAIAAVDVSVWINIATKGMRNFDGSKVINSHLLYLFKRICRMLELGLKPIFVFDGTAPSLKCRTTKKRKQSRLNQQAKRDRKRRELLTNRLVSSNIDRNIAGNMENLFSGAINSQPTQKDVFDLPNNDYTKNIKSNNEINTTVATEIQVKLDYGHFLDNTNVMKDDFNQLPLNDQYKILNNLREGFKHNYDFNSSCDLKINDISKNQFDRLMRKAKITQKLNEIENKIRQQSLNQINDDCEYLGRYKKIIRNKILAGDRLASDEHSYYLLLQQEGFILEEDSSKSITDESISSDIKYSANNSKLKPLTFVKHPSKEKMNKKLKKSRDLVIFSDLALSEDDSCSADDTDSTQISNDVKEKPTNLICSIEDNTPRICKKYNTTDKPLNNVVSRDNETLRNIDSKSKTTLHEEHENKEDNPYKNNLFSSTKDSLTIENVDTKKNNDLVVKNLSDSKEIKESPKDNSKNMINEIENISKFISEDSSRLIKEINKIDRQASSITEKVILDSIELFDAFGIPWIISPGEAEAQCAHLNAISKCDFVLTNDGDALLFGAKRILKGFLHQIGIPKNVNDTTHYHQSSAKFGRIYNVDDVEKELSLSRMDLIAFALLSGCDYTPGITNIGPTKACAIIKQFSTKSNAQDTLCRFSNALLSDDPDQMISKSLKNVHLNDNFPSKTIIDAFINPLVDRCEDVKFIWSGIQKNRLNTFCHEKFKWDDEKFNSALYPVEKAQKSHSQCKITRWFPVYEKQ